MRINKWFANVCSRREADRLIEEGRVKVDGVIAIHGMLVSESSVVTIDDAPIIFKQSNPRLFLYHKPRGLIVSERDELNRQTVFHDIPKELPRLLNVGRLDLDSEGLLLFTNSSAKKQELEKSELKRIYKVRVFGDISAIDFSSLKHGSVIDGINYKPIEIDVVEAQKSNKWLRITLIEGKNREIRKIMTHLGLRVSRLIRISYGKWELGNLPPRHIRETFF